MRILIILLIVLIFFLVYIALINKNRILPIKKLKYHRIQNRKLNDILSNNYYFSIWYNIQGVKTNNVKMHNLLSWLLKSNKNIECNNEDTHKFSKISLSFSGNLNNIFLLFNNENGSQENNNFHIPERVPDIPLDGWNNIIVNVNQNIVDVYINGELRKTMLSNVLGKAIAHGSNTVCLGNNSLDGFYGNVIFGKDSISTEEAYNIYKKGLGENKLKQLINRYRLKTSILHKNNEIGSLEL